jgi:hypothetical protein
VSEYNYLGLVNDVNLRLNEVPLNSNNFITASGFYGAAKDAVNSSLRAVNYQQFQWPFNHVEVEEVLTAGTTRYPYPSDAKTVKFDSFRIKRSSTLNVETRKLMQLDYEEFLEKYADTEYNPNTVNFPRSVFRTPSMEFGFYPTPDKAYTLVYEYYRLPVDLALATDVPSVPEQFRHIIVDGAMHHAYLFRSNMEAAVLAKNQFDAGLNQMRTIYINREEYLRSTVRYQGAASAATRVV